MQGTIPLSARGQDIPSGLRHLGEYFGLLGTMTTLKC